MADRKHNEPFRAGGDNTADAMREYAGDCGCDEPGPGESGVIVCVNCALLTWAKEVDALIAANQGALRLLTKGDVDRNGVRAHIRASLRLAGVKP